VSELDRPGINQSFAKGLVIGSVVLFGLALIPVATHKEEELSADEERRRDEFLLESAGPGDTMVAALAAYASLGILINLLGDLVKEHVR